MTEKVENFQKSCYNLRILQHISMFNNMFEWYFDWAKI